MSLIYIPQDDLSLQASQATSIKEFDYGFIKALQSKSFAFRIGSTNATTFTLTINSKFMELSETPPAYNQTQNWVIIVD